MNPQRKIVAQRTPCGDERQRETQIAVDWQQHTVNAQSSAFFYPSFNELCGLSAAKNINYNGKQQQEAATTTTCK